MNSPQYEQTVNKRGNESAEHDLVAGILHKISQQSGAEI